MTIKPLKILVIDDNRDFCDSVSDILKLEGHEVWTAYTGQSAIEQVKRERFTAILIDLVMPDMDGVTAIKSIRRISPSVPIVLITGFGGEARVEAACSAGIVGKLDKPLDFQKLLALLETVPSSD